MKKNFTLLCALLGMVGVAKAADVEEISVCKHSYVLVCDEYTNNGTGQRTKGALFGDGFFLDMKGGSVATNKGKSNPAEKITVKDEAGNVLQNVAGEDSTVYRYGDVFAKKYGEYGAHYNSLRIKNDQDVLAMNVTAGSKIIFLLHGNNKTGKDARYPKISKNADLSEPLNAAPTADFTETTSAGFKYEWTTDESGIIYIGSYNGDTFLGYVIVEANEAPGTPSVKVGPQSYESGLYFREVTCKANDADINGDGSFFLPTVCTYTVDGTAPTKESPVYSAPIKCYKNQTVKFQAFFSEEGKPGEVCENADNEGIVTFSFNAPAITVDGANVTVASEYEGAKNYISYLDQTDVEANEATLTESATLTAYSKIVNGEYDTFTTKSASKDVYVLNPIKEKKTIAVVAGKAVVDEEATATSTTGPVYTIEGGKLNTDKMDFFVKNLVYGALPNTSDSLAKYQVPAGKEGYIKMTDTNITFAVAEGDSVNVTVRCTKNSCKNLTDAADASHLCYVNVNGTTYGDTLYSAYKGTTVEDLDKFNNVIKFGLKGAEGGSNFTFQKYSGTGNIMISSIVIQPYNDGKDDEPEYEMEEEPVTGPIVPEDKSNLAVHLEAKGQWGTYSLSNACPFTFDQFVDYKITVGNVVGSFNILIESVETHKATVSWSNDPIDESDAVFYDNPVVDGTICGTVIRGNNLKERMAEKGCTGGIRTLAIQACDKPEETLDKIDILEVILITPDGKEYVQKLGGDGWGGGAYTATALEYTGIEEVNYVTKTVKAQKMLINGKLVIKTNKGTFNAAGILVK